MSVTASQVLGNSGTKPTIVWRGTTYTVSFNCPAVAEHMEQAVLKHLLATKKRYEAMAKTDPDMKAELAGTIGELQDVLNSGQWGLFQPYYNDVASTPAFACLPLYAGVKDNHPEFTLENAREMLVDHSHEVNDVLAVTYPSFLPAMAKASNLPLEKVKEAYEKEKAARTPPTTTATT